MAEHEAAKRAENNFKAKCKAQRQKLEAHLEQLESLKHNSVDVAKLAELDELHNAELARAEKLSLQLAQKLQACQKLQRAIDEVPTRVCP